MASRILQITSYNPPKQPVDPKKLPEPETPDYPKFGIKVSKYRKLPRTPENIAAHFEALMSQLATIQKAEFRSNTVEPDSRSPCASGTLHTNGKAILKAINEQNARNIEGALAESWKRRTDAQVKIAYEAAMKGEHAPLTYLIYT